MSGDLRGVTGDERDELTCECRLALLRQSLGPAAGEAESDGVFCAVKPDAGLGNIVGDHEVTAFAGQFVLRMLDEFLRLSGEADEVTFETKRKPGRAEDVFRALYLGDAD